MDVLFQSRDEQAKSLDGWVAERVRFALRRWSSRVLRATIHLSDEDGHRHGVDKRCRVEIVPDQGPRVVVVAVARHWQAALLQALGKAVYAFKRGFMRRRDGQRPSAPLAVQ